MDIVDIITAVINSIPDDIRLSIAPLIAVLRFFGVAVFEDGSIGP